MIASRSAEDRCGTSTGTPVPVEDHEHHDTKSEAHLGLRDGCAGQSASRRCLCSHGLRHRSVDQPRPPTRCWRTPSWPNGGCIGQLPGSCSTRSETYASLVGAWGTRSPQPPPYMPASACARAIDGPRDLPGPGRRSSADQLSVAVARPDALFIRPEPSSARFSAAMMPTGAQSCPDAAGPATAERSPTFECDHDGCHMRPVQQG